ncbi:MAG: hypothetical protein O3A00_11830 [Planctomycetota bacterium]|nr:hypothetical protein [Planctomycetota bacterium]
MEGENAIAETSRPADTTQPIARQLPRWAKWIVSVCLMYHLSAIALAPASVSPSSPLFQDSWAACRHYLQIMYLNHGFHFFSPEPGGSTLLEYEITARDGESFVERIPRKEIEPRLLYHRHFMLTEFIPWVPDRLKSRWLESYARHLQHRHDAATVRLTIVRHNLVELGPFTEGESKRDDPETFEFELAGILEGDAWSFNSDLVSQPEVIAPEILNVAPVPVGAEDSGPIPSIGPEVAPLPSPETAPLPDPEAAPLPVPEAAPLPMPEAAPLPDPEAAPLPDPEAAPLPIPIPKAALFPKPGFE